MQIPSNEPTLVLLSKTALAALELLRSVEDTASHIEVKPANGTELTHLFKSSAESSVEPQI